ncbi:MAG: ABC-type transport system involved in Fe-S cluster assembly fused permease/ATPase subunit [Cryomorphaceae bacterium]|jgi:ABC-type transport system involved in Fe-S cluster assembly fused permease/ATPase subunit
MRGSGTASRRPVELDKVNWSSLRQLIPYLSEFKGRIAIALLCLVGAKVASVGLPFILKNIVDQINQPPAIVLVPLALLIAYGFVRLANVLFGELRDTLFGRVTERAMRRVGHSVFQHLHSLDLAYHLNRRTGGVSRDIERGVNGISFLMRFMVFNIVPTFIEIGMIIGLLFINYSIWFAVIVFVSVVAYVGFSVLATERRTGFIREMNSAESKSSTRSVDSLLNFETVKYFNNEGYEADRYDENLAEWEAARRRNRLTLFGLNGGQSLIIASAGTASMILAANQVVSGEMSIGDFVLINALMMQIFVPLNFLGFVYREMKGSMANIDAMFALLRVESSVKDADDAVSLDISNGEIEFEAVSFAYQPERVILHDVSLKVASKQKVAIVGSSGSGKSTIMKLLFRFYDVTGGRILIDGQDIANVTQQSLRQAISVVPQDTVLFNGSIFDNIHYGDVAASNDEVWAAIKMAYLDGFIAQLPDGADTQVGERGLKLSGGEKQRVAIARAILKKPSIMVFDEATSSLDSRAEQRILKAMEGVRGDYTSVVIAHRLSTIVDADQIFVLDQGAISEAGTHAQLLTKGGLYQSLWALQNSAQ